jgi:hypothetical protein
MKNCGRARDESRTGMSFKQEVSTSKFEIESLSYIGIKIRR